MAKFLIKFIIIFCVFLMINIIALISKNIEAASLFGFIGGYLFDLIEDGIDIIFDD